MELSYLEMFLAGVLLFYVAYRIGWTFGAHRMSAAIAGRSTGLFGFVHRRRQRKALERLKSAVAGEGQSVMLVSPDDLGDVTVTAHTGAAQVEAPNPRTGQYL